MTESVFCMPESFLLMLRICFWSSLTYGCSVEPSASGTTEVSLEASRGTAGEVPLVADAASAALAFSFFLRADLDSPLVVLPVIFSTAAVAFSTRVEAMTLLGCALIAAGIEWECC